MNKKIIVGITGGIAAYKIPQLIRLFAKNGDEVKVVATKNALQFVTELTLETVSGNAVYSDVFAPRNEYSTEHIALADWADMIVVAPATANIIGKFASGIADDALSTLLLAFAKDIVVCPAMNTNMYNSPVVQENLNCLKNKGVNVLSPADGELACGTSGVGRMPEPEEIFEFVEAVFAKKLSLDGKTVLVTAGPTYERIDSVRFIGNFSTGKMGFAVAEELAERGAKVILVAGPTSLTAKHRNIKQINIESAREMYATATENFGSCDAAILSAAVADYRPENVADHKIKKTADTETLDIHLVQNPDILATLGKMKNDHQLLVGFALETDNELDNARSKLARKNLDMIVLNSLKDKGAGFGHDTNKVTIITADGTVTEGTLKSKADVAKDIVDKVEGMMG
ncbi:MAG: bifunctional phosphopantothenoylcysteine decarboxylase/phosphopantothenate--cysteine ligase CoaBC [Bacteroidales bacterium]|nr:bifunctional phosphopantothenoylcysteine decarboxylase/phosphopantothenate--cysteine ligase CoaBC [Bacteroidales bacterium]